jgi:GTP-binding protein
MLSDRAHIHVRAGRGGNGCVSFRREKHVPRGGPDGGDGGRGGDVTLAATRQQRDLAMFRHRRRFHASHGRHGQGQRRHGRDGEILIVDVPLGTEVRDADSGELLGDLAGDGQTCVVARGGEGGRGNCCFASSTRRAPRFAERGLDGDERRLDLSLKLLADVGLVGPPNAGKSSLLAALTNAQPKIAPYPFTTVEPNLGALDLDGRLVVLADIPGLVAGASRGTGLGDRFLAHIERTAVLVYTLDGSTGAEAAASALATVRAEVEAFKSGLAGRPAVVALNKSDLMTVAEIAAVRRILEAAAGAETPVVPVSALSGAGVAELVSALAVIEAGGGGWGGPPPPPPAARPAAGRRAQLRLHRVVRG